jgi:hypothetical protein
MRNDDLPFTMNRRPKMRRKKFCRGTGDHDDPTLKLFWYLAKVHLLVNVSGSTDSTCTVYRLHLSLSQNLALVQCHCKYLKVEASSSCNAITCSLLIGTTDCDAHLYCCFLEPV